MTMGFGLLLLKSVLLAAAILLVYSIHKGIDSGHQLEDPKVGTLGEE